MKTIVFLSISALLITSCQHSDKDEIKKEIFQAEKAFEKMAAEKGIAEAFYYFADEKAVIKRENDTLIIGKEDIKSYYNRNNSKDATVNWTPDFIDVSEEGTLAYTYGKYVWKIKNKEGSITEYKGIFHTVWKKQEDGDWKYVWD
ncbi:nuclear transport factor 2 family protein [Flavihumibacter sp. R14]|nr:nuclear transport factor 2 family protein [Flavihumibacter soli]